ncbi:MAG TPA: hypothetical protein VGK99_17825 [Acidobacteriota bacterium]|jgi:hypothetical protein
MLAASWLFIMLSTLGKLSSKLTLNLGVRYDNFGFFTEWNQRQSVGHFPTGKILIPNDSQSRIHPVFQQFKGSLRHSGRTRIA